MTGRRDFLRKAAIAGVGTAAGVFALPSTPEASDALMSDERSPSANATDQSLSVTAEDTSPYALWQYKKRDGGYAPTSPINVVFPLSETERGLDDVMDVLFDAGWYSLPVEYVRYAWNRKREAYEHQQATAAETFYGTVGRRHVRCWELEGAVSMQAHEDTAATPNHGIESYRQAQRRIEQLFDEAGWTVDESQRFANEKSPDHDGHVTVIRP
ncbi:twin-arginine translocation signal domain-containing protein [Halostella sp. PRR32]|uniref:twin-arginine translocation signal domain-containing protein n=1 Tax=Halostella sp. PRR32 TaxID=3098147 RepID=UPI002B1DC3E8|nr:twin-arginine translocation signal domain-containing protein [Halostella sp. PRR32]